MEPVKISVTWQYGNQFATQKTWSDRIHDHFLHDKKEGRKPKIVDMWRGWGPPPALPE